MAMSEYYIMVNIKTINPLSSRVPYGVRKANIWILKLEEILEKISYACSL